MNPGIVIQFRVKCKCHLVFILHTDNFPIDRGKDFHAISCLCDIWCTDEGHRDFSNAF